MADIPDPSVHAVPYCFHVDDVLGLSEDGKYVKRKSKYERLSAAEQGFCKATKAVEISLQLASGSAHGGVLLPADIRQTYCHAYIVCQHLHGPDLCTLMKYIVCKWVPVF